MLMRRIMLMVTAALVTAAMMVAMAAPAFAVPKGCTITQAILNCPLAGGDSEQSGSNHYLVNNKTGTILYQQHYNIHGTDLQQANTCKAQLGNIDSTDCHGTLQTPR